MNELFFVLLTIFGIGFLIFIHEAGHYVAARLAGIRVLAFSLGFGPRLWGFVRGGTDYRLSAVPLGGYVRVVGEDPGDHVYGESGGLHSKSVPLRAMFFLGGVVMNLLFAFVAFPIVFKAGVQFTAPVLGDVERGGPAWEKRLQPGDRVLEVGGKAMYSFENMQVEIALAGDLGVALRVQRGDAVFEETVVPRYDPVLGLFSVGVLPPIEPQIEVVVDPGSVAERRGLRTGDVLLSLDGEPVSRQLLQQFETRARYGTEAVRLEVARGGDRVSVEYVPEVEVLDRPEIGVVRAQRRVAGLRPGLAALDALGLQRGDHVVEVDGRRFAGGSFAGFATGPEQLTMLVERSGGQRVGLSAPFTPEERAALDDHVGLQSDDVHVVVVPRPGSPAEAAGLRPADRILQAGDHPVETWEDLRRAVEAANDGEPLALTVAGDDGTRAVSLPPALRATQLGFYTRLTHLREPYRKATVGGAIAAGMVCSVDLIKSLYVTLKKLFTGDVAAKNLGGIITISRVTYRFAQSGWERFVYFLALLSINLAVINLLPIPVLDGGHLLFVLIEGIKGSPVSPRVLNYSQILGMVFIVALLVFVTYNDILRLL